MVVVVEAVRELLVVGVVEPVVEQMAVLVEFRLVEPVVAVAGMLGIVAEKYLD